MPDEPDIPDQTVMDSFAGVLIDYDNIEHYRGLLRRQLLLNRCQSCGYWIYPHYPMCPECWSTDVTPTQVSGAATVHFYTFLYQRSLGSELGLDYSTPIPDVAFELAERRGLRYAARLTNCDNEALHVGMPVRLVWIDVDGIPAPAFEPTDGVNASEGGGRV
jgi:uncharacterized OB-fold protein